MTLRKLVSLVVLLLPIALPVSGQRPAASRLDRPAAIRRALDATVSLLVIRGTDSVQGSGFFVAPIGILVTAAHVVDGASLIQVNRSSGVTNDVAGVYLVDRDHDFALLKIDVASAPVIRLGNSDSVTIGERVIAVGSPLGLQATVTDGLISAERMDGDRRLLQISIPVSPGSSGGPVLSEDGRVVGVVVSGIRGGGAENLNFALPINYVRAALTSAASSEPVPVSDAITVTQGGSRAPLVHAAESRNVGPAGRVNDSIDFDWKALDGISIYAEDNDHTRTLRWVTNYKMTTDVSGTAVLERQQTLAWNQHYKDQFTDESRVTLDAYRNSRQFYRRYSIDPNLYRTGSTESSLTDGEWRIDSDWRGSSRATLTVGVLPSELVGAAIAALPDSLPPSMYIWFFNWDTSFVAHVTPIRFDFGEREILDVSISKRGEACEQKTSTAQQELPVIWVTETEGATRTTFPILASRPHVRVDPPPRSDASSATRECIRVPGMPLPR